MRPTKPPYMSKITLASPAPGIIGLLETFPVTAAALNGLAQLLLRGTHKNVSILPWEREYIAASVSATNSTEFCRDSHYAAALACSPFVADRDMHRAFLENEKLRGLEVFATDVASHPHNITEQRVLAMKHLGATDEDIHLVTLISAAFCMYNRYVTVLGNGPAPGTEAYRSIGEMLCAQGYK